MTKRLDDQSRGILDYRPNISFVEPDQQPGEIEALEEPIQLESTQELRSKVKQYAKAVNQLATAVQARADIKAENMVIKLDPVADAATVASMKRMFGHKDINPYEITYAQYKECKERMRKKGEDLGQRMILKEEDIEEAKNKISSPTGAIAAAITEKTNKNPVIQFGGSNTEEARNGGLRPELQSDAVIVEPIDMEVLQAYLVRIFVNAIWENFIRPVFPSFIKDALPEQLAEIPSDGFSAEELVSLGVPVLGYDKPEQEQPDIPSSAPEGT